MVMKMKTVCFTGRRPQKLPWGYNETDERCINLKQMLAEKIEKAEKHDIMIPKHIFYIS